MKKNLILYFDAPFEVSFAYQYIKKWIRIKQEELLSCFPQEQVDIFMARGNKSYVWGNTFIPQFQKIGKKWKKIHVRNITADIVLGFPIPTWVTAIFPSIRDISLEKTYIERLFPKYTLRSLVCQSYKNIEENFYNIQSSLKVLKPLCGTRGRGIKIQETLPLKEELPEKYFPYILQEFFDTSSGWEWYIWYHDFRVVILNGQVIWKFLRQPKKGSYISNTHKKWAFYDLTEEILPDDVREIVSQIDDFLVQKYPVRFYSIDFGRNTDGELKIFEVNSAPGLSTPFIAQSLGNYIRENILKI